MARDLFSPYLLVFVPKGSDYMVDKNEIVVSYSITQNWDGPLTMQAVNYSSSHIPIIIWIHYQIMFKICGSTMLIVQPNQ